MKLTAIAPAYFPDLNYLWRLAQADHIILTDHFQYVKRSTLTVSAPLNEDNLQLHIPVLHDKKPRSIHQKDLADSILWRKKHLSSIYHLFHNTPFAYYYLPQLEHILLEAPGNLSIFLYEFLQAIVNWLHLPARINIASKVGFEQTNEESIQLWCKKFFCEEYLAENIVYEKRWIKRHPLEKGNIFCHTFVPMPKVSILESYKNFSILNFIFQFGPEAGYLLRQYLPE